ncbi:TPA: hypothetical protein ACH3X1_006611 [Trebouxia sp. C0004]
MLRTQCMMTHSHEALSMQTARICFRQQQYSGQKEQNVLDMVLRTTPPGNPEAVLDAIDNYGWNCDFLMNIGDRKGAILDQALQKRQPQVAIELGGYIGYSAVRIASQLPPGGKLYSIDPNESHVRVARSLVQHAGLSDKVEVIQGILETSIQVLHQRGAHTVDFALIDHVKHLYVKDLLVLQKNGFLKKGSVVVGDNVLTPGSPEFRKHVQSDEYTTVEHLTNLEYSNYILDIVTVSKYKGREGPQ